MARVRMNAQDNSIDRRWSSRTLAVAEPLFLLVAISLIAAQLAPLIGLATRADRNAILFGEGPPDWLAAAIAESEWLGLRFGLTLLAAWAIAAWRGGPTRREASLSTGGHSVIALIAMGMGVCLVMLLPVRLATAIDFYHPLGERTPMWDLMARSEWTPEFWLFMAASSFVIVPIVEELFFRAYMLGRFRENFTAGGAALLTAVLFWIAHGQYITGDPYLAFHSVSVLLCSIVMAWMTLKTGSLIPVLTAHVLFNIPGQFAWNAGWVVVALVTLVAWRRTAWRYLKEIFALLATTREWLFLLVAAAAVTALVVLIRAEPNARFVAVGVFFLLFIGGLLRRRRRG
jgi:membrane protease YdiL (CAAX protease family)